MKCVRLEGAYIIKASRERVYAVITDFEGAPKYFPSVAKSVRIISRDGNNLIVEAQTKAFLGSRTFKVHMEALLQPHEGFTSTNTSSVCVEHESLKLQEVPEGTRIVYVNDVEITSPLFCLFANFLMSIALKYWEWAYIRKLKKILESGNSV